MAKSATARPPGTKLDFEPVLKLNFLSHGTLESRDLDRSRDFYERFLGLETIRTSPISLMIRLGGQNTIAVVRNPTRDYEMPRRNHNGLDVESTEDVDRAYALVVEQSEKWGITEVTKPEMQHGSYSFYFKDLDKNWWEILTNPSGGYSWLFEQGGDLQGKGHQDKAFARPGIKSS